MKNSKKICLALFIILVVIAIFMAMYFCVFRKDSIIKDLDIINDNIVLEVGDTKNLAECFIVNPTNASTYVNCFISNAVYAEISPNNIITAKSVGTTTIIIKCEINNKNVEKEISLSVIEKKILPSTFGFESSLLKLGLASNTIYNRIVCNESYNIVPTINYSNIGICTYNAEDGKITPISIGTTTVTVTFTKGETVVSNSFTVTIEENYRSIETNLTKENDYYILVLNENSISSFSLKIVENEAVIPNAKLKFDFGSNILNASVVQYEYNIVMIKATIKGETTFKIYYEDDPAVFINVKIKVE